MSSLANSEVIWERLEGFAKRYTAPKAKVSVYCLHEQAGMDRPVTMYEKKKGRGFQLPDCKLPVSNGISLPSWIKMPLESNDLSQIELFGWNFAMK